MITSTESEDTPPPSPDGSVHDAEQSVDDASVNVHRSLVKQERVEVRKGRQSA